jgi:hypothetical protein
MEEWKLCVEPGKKWMTKGAFGQLLQLTLAYSALNQTFQLQIKVNAGLKLWYIN